MWSAIIVFCSKPQASAAVALSPPSLQIARFFFLYCSAVRQKRPSMWRVVFFVKVAVILLINLSNSLLGRVIGIVSDNVDNICYNPDVIRPHRAAVLTAVSGGRSPLARKCFGKHSVSAPNERLSCRCSNAAGVRAGQLRIPRTVPSSGAVPPGRRLCPGHRQTSIRPGHA